MFVQEFCQGCNFSCSCTWMMPLRLKRGVNECRSEKCAAKFLCATSARIKTNRRASFARRCGNGSIARWNYQGTFGSGFGGTKLSRHLNDHNSGSGTVRTLKSTNEILTYRPCRLVAM